MERIAARDSRTLFVKFLSDSLPTDIKQVKVIMGDGGVGLHRLSHILCFHHVYVFIVL